VKIRSKALRSYLLEAGVLNGAPEQIAYAKQAYRKQYKKQWKKRLRPQKEIRYTVTIKQFEVIRRDAQRLAMKHSTYAKYCLLERSGQPPVRNDCLLEILQLVSMATIAVERKSSIYQVQQLMQKAELKLLDYLKV
jgi:hypothetical protein